MRILKCTVAFAATVCLFSQTLATPPAFEVASVKPSNPQARIPAGMFTYPGGRVVANLCTLEYLIEQAFDVPSFQITGGPGWIKNDRFDIEAKPPASSLSSKANPFNFKLPPNDEQRQMLQTLLADRFQLKFHRENREGLVYALTKSNKALKLQDSKNKEEYPWAGIGPGLVGTNISMPQFAKRLAAVFGHPVLDQTGLTGSFDFRFEYHSDDPHPDPISSVITSIQGLGLKLEVSKGPVETIVIDHAEKPAEN
jgi:uncharacterized protein (TIGR03435 family)